MQGNTVSRRTALAVTAGSVLAGISVATANDDSDADEAVTRDSFEILEGTDRETTVYVTTARADGPTVLVVGGVHGNEVAGYAAADGIREWTVDAGTLVVIPEVNAVAIERGTRTADDGVDLNRQFPEGGEPETELARAIWDVVAEYDPDTVVDLHESTGIYAGDPVDGVGQAIFRSSGGETAARAVDAVDYVNRTHVDDPDLAFQVGRFSAPDSDPQGLLVHKAARDLGADAYLVETLSTDVDLETRVRWHSAIAERLVANDLFSAGEPDGGDDTVVVDDDENATESETSDETTTPDEDGDVSIGNIVDETPLEPGQTVVLDGSCSSTTNGEIVCYEWDVGGDGCFDQTGERIEVTISANGDHTVVLRATDEAGVTATREFTLTAN